MNSVLHRALRQPAWVKLTWLLVAWTLLTLGGGVFGIWLAIHNSSCSESLGIVMFCRYNAAMNALGSARGPLLAYAAGTLALGLLWARALPDRPPCPECGAQSRTETGACRRCGYDPFAAGAGG